LNGADNFVIELAHIEMVRHVVGIAHSTLFSC
jgi:hypothetical protein